MLAHGSSGPPSPVPGRGPRAPSARRGGQTDGQLDRGGNAAPDLDRPVRALDAAARAAPAHLLRRRQNDGPLAAPSLGAGPARRRHPDPGRPRSERRAGAPGGGRDGAPEWRRLLPLPRDRSGDAARHDPAPRRWNRLHRPPQPDADRSDHPRRHARVVPRPADHHADPAAARSDRAGGSGRRTPSSPYQVRPTSAKPSIACSEDSRRSSPARSSRPTTTPSHHRRPGSEPGS